MGSLGLNYICLIQLQTGIELRSIWEANLIIFNMKHKKDEDFTTHLVSPRQEEVVKVLWPVEAAQAEVEALPVGAVELPLERDRVVVGPDPLVHREVLEHLDAGDDLPDHLDEEGLVTQEAHDRVDGVGGHPVEEEAQDLSHHLERVFNRDNNKIWLNMMKEKHFFIKI